VLIDILLGLLLLLVIALIVTAAMHLALGVPYVPTPRWVAREMVKAAELRKGDIVYDLGAGDGVLLIEAMRTRPDIRAIGCELVPTIWLLGYLRCLFSGRRIEFRLGDALSQDVREADVVLLYVTPVLLKKLAPILRAQLKPGARVISHAFALPGFPQGERLKIERGGRTAVLHRYRRDAA
jgi:precorrin-6B methylase 2